MIGEAIRERLTASPFRPFVVKMGSGETFEVRHPEVVSLSPGGRRMILWTGEETSADVDVLLIESVRDATSNGRGKKRSA
jgi:hypothetical protein